MTKEEAIKIIESNCSCSGSKLREACAMFIPELAENEDERIRMALIKLMTTAGENYVMSATGFKKERLLAYLEKQKESLHSAETCKENANSFTDDIIEVSSFQRGLEEGIKQEREKQKVNPDGDFAKGYDCGYACCLNSHGAEWFEKQKEQKPYTDFVIKPHKGDDTNPYDMSVSEAQEYAIKRGFGVPFNDGEVYVDERHITQTIGNILRWADEHPKEQKPQVFYVDCTEHPEWYGMPPKEQKPVEIHIDDPNIEKLDPDVKITTGDSSASGDELLYVCNKSYKIGYRDGKMDAEQKPAEWSEEDEELWADIKSRMISVTFITSDKIAWLENRLKSLRPQPKKQDVEKYPEDKSFEDEWKDYYNNSLVSRLSMNKREVAKHFYWFAKKNAWKPSEEQMSALNYFIKLWGNSDDQLEYTKIFNTVKSLRNELKKLM